MRFKCRHIVSFWCSRIVATPVSFSPLGAQIFGECSGPTAAPTSFLCYSSEAGPSLDHQSTPF